MELRRSSLLNRVWENESLDILGQEEYVRRIYENECRPWMEICNGLFLSAWKGIRYLFMGRRGADRANADRANVGDEENGLS